MAIRVTRPRFLSRLTSRYGYALLCLAVGLWGSGCTPLIIAPTPAASRAEPAAAPLSKPVEARLIVQVHFPTVTVLNKLAGELDIWEVDRNAQTFVARITLAQYDALLQQALPVVLDCAKMRQYEQELSLTVPAIAKMMQEQCPESNS